MKKKSLRVYDVERAKVYGEKGAMVLQQIDYWMKKATVGWIDEKTGLKWVYMTYVQLNKQFPHWSFITVRRAVESLRKKGAIETKKEYELRSGTNRSTLYYRVLKMSIQDAQNDHTPGSKRASKMIKMSTPYNTNTTTENTREYIQKRSVPFSEKKEEQKTLPKGRKKPRYVDGNMSRLFQKAEKWLKEQPEELQEHVGDYLQRAMKDKPIGNQRGYAKTIMIDIWKEQTGREHNTSFRYDAEAIQASLEQMEARYRIGNLF